MNKILALILLVALLNIPLLATTSLSINDGGDDGLQDAPWPMFSHDIRHTGRSGYDTSGNTGTERWRYETTSAMSESSPCIDKDGTIYVGSSDYKLWAFNHDGTLKWIFKTDGRISSSPALEGDGTIYVGSNDGKLYAIYPNGTMHWKVSLGGGWVFSSPVIGSEGIIYACSVIGSNLCAVYPNGSKKWEFKTSGWIYSSPAIDDEGTIYIGSHDHNLYAIYPNGTEKWRYKAREEIKSAPAIGDDGTIYVGSWDDYLYAINPDGTKRWQFDTGGSIDSSPAIGKDGIVYIGSYNGKLYAINPDGTGKWFFDTGSSIYSSPSIGGDGTIFITSWNSMIFAINPDGTEKWRYDIGEDGHISSSPAIGGDGTIYFGSICSRVEGFYGYLHAIGGGINIVEPRKGYLYIAYREIGPTRSGDTILIGRTIFKVSSFLEEHVDKVEFYLDDQLIETVYETPFAIMLDETAFWKHTILAKAYYTDGNTPTDQMDVTIFNI